MDYFEKTLALEPAAPDALLGEARALAELGRFEASLGLVDRLLALERWYPGDARYLRAFDELQLGRNDDAWRDIELAAALMVNAAVPKLAGIIAYRRQDLPVSRAKLEESRRRNREDCETGFYLGVVLSEQQAWGSAFDVLQEAASCLVRSQEELKGRLELTRASAEPPARKARQEARYQAFLASASRMLISSWWNSAVASFNLNRLDAARLFAEKVRNDDELGERARSLIARMR